MAIALDALDDRSLAQSVAMRSPADLNDARIPPDRPFGEFNEIAA
jgi:hypothetical protein